MKPLSFRIPGIPGIPGGAPLLKIHQPPIRITVSLLCEPGGFFSPGLSAFSDLSAINMILLLHQRIDLLRYEMLTDAGYSLGTVIGLSCVLRKLYS